MSKSKKPYMFLDVFESTKERKCYGDNGENPCGHTIQKGEVYVFGKAGAVGISFCKDCFLAIADRLKRNIVFNSDTGEYETKA